MGNNANQSGQPNMSATDNNLLMSILAYLGPFVIVSYIVARENPTVKFHIKQGLVLFTIEVGVWLLRMVLPMLWPILSLINLATLVLSIVGIVRAVKGKEKELPFVGKYASHFRI